MPDILSVGLLVVLVRLRSRRRTDAPLHLHLNLGLPIANFDLENELNVIRDIECVLDSITDEPEVILTRQLVGNLAKPLGLQTVHPGMTPPGGMPHQVGSATVGARQVGPSSSGRPPGG